MKILLAVDGSEFTRHVLGYLGAHPQWFAADNALTVVTVTPAVPPRAAAVLAADVLKGYYDEAAETVLAPVRAYFSQRGVAVDMVAAVGHAADEIVRLAESLKADLIIMGSHGNGSLTNLVMGSIVTKVLAGCKTPVLVVR
jgi:nucleotide-binding universal stress UspA family protein